MFPDCQKQEMGDTWVTDQVDCKVEAGLSETGEQIWLFGTVKALVCSRAYLLSSQTVKCKTSAGIYKFQVQTCPGTKQSVMMNRAN